MPPIPDSSMVMVDPLEVTSPAGPAGESPAGDMSLLAQRSLSGSVARASVSPRLPWTSIYHGMVRRWRGSLLIALCFLLP